jgi:hypothetical protein
MRKLFVHQPLFRLLSPVFSGFIVYLLLLLLNNNVGQIQEEFFNSELYFCIGLCYLIQEFSRVLLLLFKHFFSNNLSAITIVVQILVSLFLCVLLSTIAINLFFEFVLGFSVTIDEIYVFDSILCVITFFYILLYVSHQYLYTINTDKLNQELLIKKNIEEDFRQFKRGINPNLLFESLEFLLVLIKTDKEQSDDFIDNLATIYRYILSKKNEQLIEFPEELNGVHNLVTLLNYLPNTEIKIQNNCKSKFLVVPGSLLFLIEQIARTSIASRKIPIAINIREEAKFLIVSYLINDKINDKLSYKDLKDMIKTYKIYSKEKITILEDVQNRQIKIPRLEIQSEL